MLTQAQSYKRGPLEPSPADRRCQARRGSLLAIASARNLPAAVVTWWLQATAST